MNRAVLDVAALEERARTSHRQALIVVGAITSSLFVYAIVVELVSRSGASFGGAGAPEVLRWAFYAVAVTMVFTSHVVKSIMLRGIGDVDPEQAFARLTTAHIVTAAMAEAPAVLGLVLFILDRRFYVDFYILCLVALYLLFRHFPRYAPWESAVRRYQASL